MTPRDSVQSWLTAIGSQNGETFSLNEDGACAMQFGADELVMIEVPEDQPVVFVNAPIMPLPEDPEERFRLYEYALQCNLFQGSTGGGALAIDPAASLLALCYSEEIRRLDAEEFGTLIQHAANTLTAVRAGLADYMPEKAEIVPEQEGPTSV